jgi:hypothetical protein
LRTPAAAWGSSSRRHPREYPLGGVELGKLFYELRPFRIDAGQAVGNALPLTSDIVQCRNSLRRLLRKHGSTRGSSCVIEW